MKKFLEIPRSIPELQREFEDGYTNFYAKRDHALARRLISEDDWALLHAADGTGEIGYALLASNGSAAKRLVRQKLRAFRRLSVHDPRTEFLHITIIDKRWITSDERTVINLPTIKQQARTILSAMGKAWFAKIELSVFTNVRHCDGGKLLSPHVHAIVHGRDIHKRASEVAARRNMLMSRVVGDMDPVRVQLIGPTHLDLARVVRYPWMGPERCKTAYFNPRTQKHYLHESEAPDRYVRFLRQFQIHSLLQLNELCFARGPLTLTRTEILRDTFSWLKRRVPVASRRIELERMAAFWAEFMPRLGHSRFHPPVIYR